MADTDEAAVHLPTSHDSAPQIETDLSDETQDFRFLNNLAFPSDSSSQTSLPKRGEKDFEPNPTLYQSDVLASSRQAMHNALSFPRLHHPKHRVVGFYAPDGPAPPPSALKNTETMTEEGGKPLGQQETTERYDSKPRKSPGTGVGVGVPANSCVYVPNPKGQYFKSMGQADRWNRVWLLPEEALYLIERGSLDIRWQASVTGSTGKEEGEEGQGQQDLGIPMSLQAAYACFVGSGGLTLDRFSVYTGLRRLGYTVIRAPGWDNESGDGDSSANPEGTSMQKSEQQGPFGRFLNWLYSYSSSSSTGLTTTGPVVGLGIHRSYTDIYRKLAIIQWHDPTTSQPPAATPPTTTPPFRVIFNVYKPSTSFRKSAPPAPDFRIAVVNARTQTTIPNLSQLGALLESTPLDPPRGEKMDRLLYMRLRHGYRNVILGVVDQGVVSFLRIGDAAFGKEKLYAEKPRPFNKGGYRPKPKGK